LSEESINELQVVSLLVAAIDVTSNAIQVSLLTQLSPEIYVHFSVVAAAVIASQ
jgi:hypothetical protein